ncbi:hypothetical protein [Methanogenium cariaci]
MILKKRMRALSVLLVLLLVSVVAVSAMSATTSPRVVSLNETFQLVDNVQPPLFDWSGFEPASPMEGSDLTTIVLSEAYIARQVGSQTPEIVDISLPFSAFGETNCSVERAPNCLIQIGIAEDEPVMVLTIPSTMFRSLNAASDRIELSLPLEYFSHYKDTSSYRNRENAWNIIGDSQESLSDSKITTDVPLETFIERGGQQYLSRVRFMASSDYEVTYLSGKIKPYYYANSGNGYTIFQEREINLNRFDSQGEPIDTIEIVVEYEDTNHGGGIKLYPVIYDDGLGPIDLDSGSYIDVSRSALPHEYNYYVTIGSGSTSGKYEIWFQDTTTEEWLGYYYYNDNDNPSQFIRRTVGSSELLLWDGSTFSFDARTSPITDEWCKQGVTWSRPTDVFSYYESQDDSYVSTSYSTGSGKIYTHSYCSGSGSS